ncbi:MAG TPA: circadian clock KaiB family protein [Candidatus Limnocylindrales bacterium]|nr:circadian clock KaiB family protein [Candidatus Limnocylindrales bacterium]
MSKKVHKQTAKRKGKRPAKKPGAPVVYVLRLYITGHTPRSDASVRNLQEFCEKYLADKFELHVIDIYQQPELAKEGQIIAAPTLVKTLPLPLRRLVGDLSNQQQVMRGLDIKEYGG